ncbi:PH domain-containing protein [Anaerovorax odorimutans]|uniref:PH domain-containing protein n=1 Tax=Anaerovorax odorimutans TaxID=109327 RepID=A0ABT1RSR2_9FIRM|nr:PH domain-containing protein [Anaerovorax odorimutans]MCQ4638240.1 PH domain-containing protein [Anaerovorax odorimutans]
MDYIKLDKKAITSWRIGRAISFVILLLICCALWAGSIFIPQTEPYRWILQLVLGLLMLYKLLGILIYPLIEYRQWGYYITEDKVDIRHGIFFVTNTIIPIIRIQHITVSQGPINRRMGLYGVEMSLASNSFKIECLAKEVADEIAENLKNRLYTRLEAREEGQ